MTTAICPICKTEVRPRQRQLVRRYDDGWKKLHVSCASSPKLTPAQQVALARCTAEWQSAYRIGASIATLDALVKRGILERRTSEHGYMFSPRTAISYRLAAANK